MAFQGQIKRSTTHGATPTLAAGELGANLTDGLLWAGTGSGVTQLGSSALFASQAAGRFYAAPSAAAGPPTFRAIAAADLAAAAAVPAAAFLRGDLAWSSALALGTLTTAVAGLTITGTYNNAAVTFPGALLVNMTDGPSSGASLLDLQLSSVSAFRVSRLGAVWMAGRATLGAYVNASPALGDLWYDAAQKCVASYDGMADYRTGVVFSQPVKIVAAAGVVGSLLQASGSVGTATMAAGFLNVVGRTIRVKANGFTYSPTVAGAFWLALYLGTTPVATHLLTTVAAAGGIVPWSLECVIVTAATGTSGTVNAGGTLTYGGSIAPVNNAGAGGPGTATAPNSPVTLDLTAAPLLDLRETISGTGNQMYLLNVTYEVLA